MYRCVARLTSKDHHHHQSDNKAVQTLNSVLGEEFLIFWRDEKGWNPNKTLNFLKF